MKKQVIPIELSIDGINQAIRQLDQYRARLPERMEQLRLMIAKRLSDDMQAGFSNAIADEHLSDGGQVVRKSAHVDVSINNGGHTTIIIANGEDAVWVEFGTGVYHNGHPGSSPHPKGAELGMIIGGYGKGSGMRQTWGFYEEGELKLTHGIPAQMPMMNAFSAILNDLPKIIQEVFR